MRALSERQASNCENARHPACKCRCGGALHGVKRGGENPEPAFFDQLPPEDPHHAPSEERQKATAKERARQRAATARAKRNEASRRYWEAQREASLALEWGNE